MVDKSSRPKHCPHQLPQRTERRIVGLRVTKRWGPARIAYHLHLNPSTVHKVIRRYGCPPLRWTDPATGVRIKTSRAEKRRYEHAAPGDLVHVDIKKLGRIPDGGGHKVLGRAAGTRNKTRTATNRRPGYAYIHNAVDDHSRLAYSEILTDEKKETAAAFWQRANAFFNAAGITVTRVLTDNGACYRSTAFKKALGDWADSTGRRNTLLTAEVFNDGDGGLEEEDQRCARGCASAVACRSGTAAGDALTRTT